MHDSLASLGHEIRGTLNALKLCISAFEMPLEPSERLEFLSDIEASAEKLAGLVEEIDALRPAESASPDPSEAAAAAAAAAATGNVR
jgi:signal transduction histidine kinase